MSSPRDTGPRAPAGEPVVTPAAYLMLLLSGALQGLAGSFFFGSGPAPLLAVVFAALILATCVLGAHGMRTALGAVLPALGWFVVSLLLTSATPGGSVLVTQTTAGEIFLYGGAVCAVAGAVYGFAAWSRSSRERRAARQSAR